MSKATGHSEPMGVALHLPSFALPSPLLSRCFDVPMSGKGLADVFAQRAMEIAQAEGMDGKPIQAYKRLMMDCRNNLRMALSKIEAGEMLS